ncbi:hypothetical protein J437_LFUL002997 [Ladona fulva]|uniref:Uncharacterized protein n=1 Tax=Ladona fulva TaxID=123851 RepID=A0A8K0JTF0_LADFU|nr:hypothetical protein J437_LFUL002997 [Ladona fulva]
MDVRILNPLKRYNLISESQHGFLKSTITAVFNLLQFAFVTVNPATKAVNGLAQNWLMSFILSRKQYFYVCFNTFRLFFPGYTWFSSKDNIKKPLETMGQLGDTGGILFYSSPRLMHILVPEQHGFSPGMTVTSLTSFNFLNDSFYNNSQVDVIYTDFA